MTGLLTGHYPLKDLLKWGWQTVLSAMCLWITGSIKI